MKRAQTYATDETRMMVGDADRYQVPAHVMEHEGARYFITGSSDLILGTMALPTGAEIAMMTQLSRGRGVGLAQSLSADELRAFGIRLQELADTMEREATAAAATALSRARNAPR